MKEYNEPASFCTGTGSEEDPFYSADGTAGISAALSSLKVRGGKVRLECGRYDIERSVVIDCSSLCCSGDVWACNTDPNGVFEPRFGTKIRMHGTDYPALLVGDACDPISGSVVRDLGVQGDIPGMDTRPLVDFAAPEKAAGLCLNKVRTDQCAFSKLAFCGLANAVVAAGSAEIDACVFENINADGCGNGFWFSPRASYYTRIRSCVIADNPYYGFYAGGAGRSIHNLEIQDSYFVRNGGAFAEEDSLPAAAVLFDRVNGCAVTHCIFDSPGTFWYYRDGAKRNEERQPSRRNTVALRIHGSENRICGNTFLHSSDDSVQICGDRNILMGNIADGNIRISGEGNTVSSTVFTKPDARLILEGKAKDTTLLLGVEDARVVRI